MQKTARLPHTKKVSSQTALDVLPFVARHKETYPPLYPCNKNKPSRDSAVDWDEMEI